MTASGFGASAPVDLWALILVLLASACGSDRLGADSPNMSRPRDHLASDDARSARGREESPSAALRERGEAPVDSRVQELLVGSLNDGSWSLAFSARAGACHSVRTVGSLVILDRNGAEVASAVADGSGASARFCPMASGEYSLVVLANSLPRGAVVRAEPPLEAVRLDALARGDGPTDGALGSCTAPIELRPGEVRHGAGALVYRYRLATRSTVRLLAEGAEVSNLEHFFGCDANGQPESPVITADTVLRPDAHSATTSDPGAHYVRVNGVGSGEQGPGVYSLALEVTPTGSPAALCTHAERLRPGVQRVGDTRRASNTFETLGACEGTGPDQVFVLEIERRSRVHIAGSFGYEYASLYVRETCERGPVLHCGTGPRDRNDAELTIDAVLGPGRYFVFVDGDGDTHDSEGRFGVTVSLEPDESAGGEP